MQLNGLGLNELLGTGPERMKMADITMCVGAGCPLRETCYRYTAIPNEYRQSFADFTVKVIHEGEAGFKCPEWVPNK